MRLSIGGWLEIKWKAKKGVIVINEDTDPPSICFELSCGVTYMNIATACRPPRKHYIYNTYSTLLSRDCSNYRVWGDYRQCPVQNFRITSFSQNGGHQIILLCSRYHRCKRASLQRALALRFFCLIQLYCTIICWRKDQHTPFSYRYWYTVYRRTTQAP